MKLGKFFISSTRGIFTKPSGVSESSIEIKVRSHWIFFVILLTAPVVCKQRLLHGSEILILILRFLQDIGK